MKRIVLLTCVLAIATLASAQLYKYVDKNGKTVYTDQPPPDAADPKAMSIPSSATGSAPPPAKSAVAQDKELQKGRDKAKENEKKAEETASRARQQEELCTNATMAYQQYSQGGRMTKLDEKGEKIFLGDAEIDAARETAKRKMDEVCKKG
jgi:hypothetical protein